MVPNSVESFETLNLECIGGKYSFKYRNHLGNMYFMWTDPCNALIEPLWQQGGRWGQWLALQSVWRADLAAQHPVDQAYRLFESFLVRITVRAAMTTSPWVPTVGHLLKGGKTPCECWKENMEGGKRYPGDVVDIRAIFFRHSLAEDRYWMRFALL